MSNESHLMDEKNLPENLVPAEGAVVIPGRGPLGAPAPPVPHDMPQFFSGSMPPTLQHDTSFVGTEVGSPRIPKYSLMPLGNQGNPFTNAAAQSTIINQITSGGSGVDLKTNGVDNTNQSILDITGGSNINVTSNGSGQVTIAGTSSSDARFISRPDYKRPAFWMQAQPVGGTTGVAGIGVVGDRNPIFTTVANFTDAIVGPSATDMPGWSFTNPAGASSADYRIFWGMNVGYFSRDFTFIATTSIISSIGSGRYWYAVTDGTSTFVFNNTDAPAYNYVGFRYSPTKTNWIGSMGNGSSTTDLDTGVAVVINTPYQLRVD